MTLTDALDDLISNERIDPQLAIKILNQFDRVISESLNEKVKARLTFKVNATTYFICSPSVLEARPVNDGSALSALPCRH